jgi:DNA primase
MMSMIPDDKVQEVRERAAILDVIADYVSLRKAGANYLGLCPFHGEKTPSFNVNPGRAIFHCFGCGVGGNAFSFIMKMEGLSFPEAVKFLAKRVGVTIEERPPTPQEKRKLDEKEAFYRISELAVRFYRRILREDPTGEPGRRYLERRGVDEATAEAYRLGFAPDSWDALTRHLEQQKASLGTAEKLGLVRKRESGGYYDMFRNRLLFTITDSYGKPVGFGGRVLDDTLPKYINSPESTIYHKSEILFGVDLAKQAMREQGAAIIVEGYFDHLALCQAGVRHVVATCGTALTSGHLKLLQRYAGKVCTLFDADPAGKKATFRAMELFLEGGLPASIVELPAGEDPDSFIRKEGNEAFAVRVSRARPIFDFFIHDLIASHDTGSVEGKVKVIEDIAPYLRKISNVVEKDLYLREIARLLGVNERTLLKKIGGTTVTAGEFVPQREKTRHKTDTEDMLLALMGKYPEVAGKVAEYGVASLFSTDLVPIAEAILAQIKSGGDVDMGLILDKVEAPEERNRLAALFVRDAHLEGFNPLKMFDDLRISKEREALRSIKGLIMELNKEESGSSRHEEIMEKINTLRNKKSQLQ